MLRSITPLKLSDLVIGQYQANPALGQVSSRLLHYYEYAITENVLETCASVLDVCATLVKTHTNVGWMRVW